MKIEIKQQTLSKKSSSFINKGVKILTPKQMFQRLPIALVQVKASNISENLLNEIKLIIIFCIKKKKLLKTYITT